MEQKFKVGDRVLFKAEQQPPWRKDLNYAVAYVVSGFDNCGNDGDEDPLVTLEGVTHLDGTPEGFNSRRFELCVSTAPAADQAMRFNNSKSDLAYFLTFDGGVEMLFPEGSAFREGAIELGEWYRLDTCDGTLADEYYDLASQVILSALDSTWPEDMAEVCQFGAKKYARGNYLKGRGLHDTCNSLLRHMLQMERGEKIDSDSQCAHDGHIAWNLAFLRHCYRTMKATMDDRIRAPKAAA